MKTKKLIRNGVFETNSSSAHSISLAGSDRDFVLDTIYPNENGIIVLVGGEFGWDWFKHNDALTKANYAIVAHINNPDLVIEVIKEQTGCDDVLVLAVDGDYNSSFHSYIDHDSYGICPSSKEELKNFIFNKNSWLFGGNDNTHAKPNFYDVPTFIGDGDTILPVYRYVLSIDGFNEQAFFPHMPNEKELDEAFSGFFDRGVILTHDKKFEYSNQWSSEDDCFEYSDWKKKADYKNNILYFVQRNDHNYVMSVFEKQFKKKYDDKTDYSQLKNIEKELYEINDSELVIGINYTLREI
jgi:hypothetical protein